MYRSVVAVGAPWLLAAIAGTCLADDPKTPSVLWQAAEPPTVDLSNPIVFKDLVIVGNGKGMLRARNC